MNKKPGTYEVGDRKVSCFRYREDNIYDPIDGPSKILQKEIPEFLENVRISS
jgi:hypothetical protein